MMNDKLNCYECKQWFDVKDLVYLPDERFYLCRPCGCTYYAKKCVKVENDLLALRARVEAAEALLKKSEFSGEGFCWSCGVYYGHSPLCELAAALVAKGAAK